MSQNVGLKVSLPGSDISNAPVKDLVIDTNYPFPKCDLRKRPKNYGILNITVASIPVSPASITIYQQPHGYGYIPGFVTAWTYPNTNPLGDNSTYGIGDIDATQSLQNAGHSNALYGPYISMYCDNMNFYITATVEGGFPLAATNTVFSVRFYIFADDFSGS